MARNIELRNVTPDDLATFFDFQLDPEANHMAAFTAKDPSDRAAFNAHWEKILDNESIIKRTIFFDGKVAGYLVKFEHFGHPAVAYWIGKQYWGQGIATHALELFANEIETRPLYARVAKDNLGSMRVLQKCGFKIDGEDKGYANAREEEIEEFILKLE